MNIRDTYILTYLLTTSPSGPFVKCRTFPLSDIPPNPNHKPNPNYNLNTNSTNPNSNSTDPTLPQLY